MKIECIGQNSMKATLTKADMERYHVTYEELDSESRATKSLILSILTRAKLQTGFDASSGKLLVEVYPSEDGGCVFAFSILDASHSKPDVPENPLVFAFEEIDPLFSCCRRVKQEMLSSIRGSCLYRTNNGYVLLVFPNRGCSGPISRLLLEYAKPLKSGKYVRAYYAEHGQPLIERQAVSLLASCTG